MTHYSKSVNYIESAMHPHGTTLRLYFKQLERRFQIGLLLAFLLPLVSLSVYFHIQFHSTLKETGKSNLSAIRFHT